MIEEIEKKSPKTYGLSWALRNKDKVFRFFDPETKKPFFGRVIGFAEDLKFVNFILKGTNEPSGEEFLLPVQFLVDSSLIEDETILEIVPKMTDKRFRYHIFNPLQNAFFYQIMAETPLERVESR